MENLSKKKKKKSLFDDVEDMLEDRLDIIDNNIVYKGDRLEEEFNAILKRSKRLEEVKIVVENHNLNKDLDFSNSIVYKISSKKTDKVYIGSTINEISKRLEGHKISLYSYDKYRIGYCSSYEIMKYGDYIIEELARYKCVDRKELEEKESDHIFEYGKLCVNIKDPKTGKILVNENERNKRINEKIVYLYELGKSRLRMEGMTKEDMIRLKTKLLEEIKYDIYKFMRTLEWYEYWRLSKIEIE
jgi:hypothetical protein